jgi:hypothetical protein
MEFITGLPKSKGNTFIMVVVDQITKYVHFFSLYHPSKASTIAAEFMEIVQKLPGVPNIIISERDPIFIGNFGMKYFLVWVLNWFIAHIFILNLMGKMRF